MSSLFSGQHLSLNALGDALFEVVFDHQDASVNTLGSAAIAELGQAIDALMKQSTRRGLVLRSAKDAGFIVGADITEFTGLFDAGEKALKPMLDEVNALFNRIEDLDCPTVALLHGDALGGGCEVTLCCDYRIAAPNAKMGLPEVKLGIMPGWGGTVRLPRLIGYDNAIEWVATGAVKRADQLLAHGLVDAIVEPEHWQSAVSELVADIEAGHFDVAARRRVKQIPLSLPDIERIMSTESARGMVLAKAGPHYPSPKVIIETLDAQTVLGRKQALAVETQGFIKLTQTDVARQLVGIFLKDQAVKRAAKKVAKSVGRVNRIGVLGAGIMGGGIAYQSASKGVPAVMKDIADEALQKGLGEAQRLVGGQVARGRLNAQKASTILQSIVPAKSYGEFGDLDVVVEAVTENPKIKGMVLAETESHMREDAVLASNTSTISITELAKSVKRPEQFVGMHFFNPVHRMPLVEVIRGEQSSDDAIAKTVSLALSMGKTPIVVNDCPGFLVNRCLFPYYDAFDLLLQEHADFRVIDKAMTKFGWPMGPAHLADVVGLDTMVHASDVMCQGFPDRMRPADQTRVSALVNAGRLGQKNGLGFYEWVKDKKGKLKQQPSEDAIAMVYGDQAPTDKFDTADAVNRLMVAYVLEAIRCLQDGIVANAHDLDIAMLYGLGFPPHRGGPMAWADSIGATKLKAMAEQYSALGGLYAVPQLLSEHAESGKPFLSV
ncbi:MAG: fatty acid oxidation complex subunit alpha FadB [Gammaproteobacteria bacterium]|nr:fatty acid oxidation complex subunit alpha FadB [Gammaproteobacteria bacterium]